MRIALAAWLGLVGGALSVLGYSLHGYSWPNGTQIAMHLQLERAPAVLQDGSPSWNASAADALAIWNQYLDTVKFVADGPTGSTGEDGANEVLFSNTIYGATWPSGVLAITLKISSQGSSFTETDVLFNANLKWNSYRGPQQGSGGSATYDLHRVALHEFGHVLGLDHPDQAGQSVSAIMNSTLGNLDQLADDDIAGAMFLYRTRITSPLSVTAYVGEPFSYQITTTGQPTSFEASGLPPELEINGSTGNITGTPSVNGTYQVMLIARGSPRDATATLNLTVSSGAHFTNPLDVAGNVGDAIFLPLRTSPPATYVSFDVLPPGLLWDNINGAISGAPIRPGSFNMKLSANTSSGMITATLHFEIGPRTHDFPTFLNFTAASDYSHTSTNSFYTPPNGLRVTRDELNKITLSATNSPRITFRAAGFAPLQPGVYEGAIPHDTIGGDKNVLDIFGGVECSQGAGTFTIKEIVYGPLETVLSFWATFEQQCTSGPLAHNFGEIRYHVDPSDQLVLPVVTAPASSIQVNQGEDFFLQVSANDGTTTYSAFGLPLGLTIFPLNGQITGKPLVAGTFVVRLFATNSVGTGETEITITVQPGPARPHSLLNISTRGRVGTGDDIMIGGFIITGTKNKSVVLRGIGPSLPVAGALADPAMRVTFPSGSQIYTNNWLDVYYPIYSGGWQRVVGTGLAPGNRLEPAVLYSLAPGPHTIGISGVNNTTGVALAEAYDIAPFDSTLANISTRARVSGGDEVLIGGFIIGGDQPTRVVLRAVGPSLAGNGVPLPLADPTMELYDANGAMLAQDDDWRTYQEQQLTQTGLAPTDDRESAMLMSLQPGAYTAIVRGKNEQAGVALVEVYNLDAN